MTDKYGRRNVPKMIAQIGALRQAIRAEGTPAVQAAWDAVEEHIDYAYRAGIPAQQSGYGAGQQDAQSAFAVLASKRRED